MRAPALVLSSAQMLYWSCAFVGIALTGLMGQRLSPWPALSTLPLFLLVAGNLLAIGPLARRMQARGRASGFQWGACLGIAAGISASMAIRLDSFALFCAAMLGLGAYQASAGFYRFAALDDAAPERRGRAAATVVGGGMLAALVAPGLTRWAHQWGPAAPYACVAALAALAWCVLRALPRQAPPPSATPPANTPGLDLASRRRALLRRGDVRLALAISASGHGLMILIMNATPLAMHAHGHTLATATQVIQWHVLGMFAPSLVAGPAIDRLGARRVALLGGALLATSAAVALRGPTADLFLASSLLLGAGWNLMLLAGTTLLAASHAPQDKAAAQPLMEWANGASAAAMSLGCGALVQTLGWQAINVAALTVLGLLAMWLAWPRRPWSREKSQPRQG